MSAMTLLIILAAIVVALHLLGRWKRPTDYWLPAGLRDARLVMVEKNLLARSSLSPAPFVGRPDRVYQLANGLHAPLEYKNRPQLYDTDIAQINLQGWLLRRSGLQTASVGYAVVQEPRSGERKAIAVPLRDDAHCERLIARYLDLIEHRAAPRRDRGPKCRSCGHQSVC